MAPSTTKLEEEDLESGSKDLDDLPERARRVTGEYIEYVMRQRRSSKNSIADVVEELAVSESIGPRGGTDDPDRAVRPSPPNRTPLGSHLEQRDDASGSTTHACDPLFTLGSPCVLCHRSQARSPSTLRASSECSSREPSR